MDVKFLDPQGTAQEAFAFMMHDRIVNLEAEVSELRSMIVDQQSIIYNMSRSYFFTFQVKTPMPPGVSLVDTVLIKETQYELLDAIFQPRVAIQPTFAVWRWYITGQYLYADVAISLASPLTLSEFEASYTLHPSIEILGIKQMFETYTFVNIVKTRFDRYDVMVGMWTKVSPLNLMPMQMSEGPFTKSTEFTMVFTQPNQDLLKIYAFVIDAWAFLLGII
jgi:hypothetical protein